MSSIRSQRQNTGGLDRLRSRYIARAASLIDGHADYGRALAQWRSRWNADYPRYAIYTARFPSEQPRLPIGLWLYLPARLLADSDNEGSRYLSLRAHARDPGYPGSNHALGNWSAMVREIARKFWLVEDFANPYDWQDDAEPPHPAERCVSATLLWDLRTLLAEKRIPELFQKFTYPIAYLSHAGGLGVEARSVIGPAERDVYLAELERLLAHDLARLATVRRAAHIAGVDAYREWERTGTPRPYIPIIPGGSGKDITEISTEAAELGTRAGRTRPLNDRIVELAHAGSTQADIAIRLGITPKTVRAALRLREKAP